MERISTLADGVITAEPEHGTADTKIPLTGTWRQGNGFIRTYSENTMVLQTADGKYRAKGTWIVKNRDKYIERLTHRELYGAKTVDDLPEKEPVLVSEYTLKFISDSEFKLIMGSGLELVYTLIE